MATTSSTPSQFTLNRLLTKLERTLLSPTASDPQLQRSQYERNKVGSNIEHARTLLLTLEKQSATVRVQTQRQQIQADLQRKRDTIQRLSARLQELNDAAEDNDEEEDNTDEDNAEDSDLLSQYGPARTDTDSGLDSGEPQGPRIDDTQANELRSRRPLQASDNHSAASTTAREQLFNGRQKPPPEPADSDVQRTETMMSHNRSEQENLTTGLLSLAQALKQSSLQFSSSLESEKDVLKRAEGGLDKNTQDMEAASQRMGMLRRMSEGQGLLGRIKLYGFIFALWVVCFLLVFVGPKLRF